MRPNPKDTSGGEVLLLGKACFNLNRRAQRQWGFEFHQTFWKQAAFPLNLDLRLPEWHELADQVGAPAGSWRRGVRGEEVWVVGWLGG